MAVAPRPAPSRRTSASKPRRRRTWVAVLCALALSVAAAGCSEEPEPGSLGPSSATGTVSATEAQGLLDTRAAAIRAGDLESFLGTLDPTNADLLTRQRRYFANLQRLPLETLSYAVLKSEWPAGLRAKSWSAFVSVPQVRVSTQLAGYDQVPVSRITGFAFTRIDGEPVIVSELTGAGKQFPGSSPAPWDLVRVHVRRGGGTLQLYDDATWVRAAEISGTVLRGIAEVRDALPFSWDGRAVVYVFADDRVLESFEGVPGGNINHLGAMTFPMYAVLGQPEVAGTRFTLLPSSVRAGQPFLDRITRHELTHVAIGERDDGAPIWFAEGLAEYVAARSIPEDQRRIATVAVSRARKGVDGMPTSAEFNGRDQAWNYALSWMACDFIAATQGEPRLWELMAALASSEETSQDAEDAVLQRVLGYGGTTLATEAARRILRIYG